MEVIRDWRHLPETARGASVALGNFDGVHLGHRRVIDAARAARPDARLAVLTFEPHPRELFRPDDPPFRLTLAPERRAALAALGVAIIYELPFDRAFSNLSAEYFADEILGHGIGARHLACGADFAFGHRRGGNTAFLAQRAAMLGIGFSAVPLLADAEGTISSTRIRRLLQEGYPERAAAELGRPWVIRGQVVVGDRIGRELGFPTANIALGRHLEPALGVYAVRVRLPDGRTLPGVADIGRRPTITSAGTTRLEVHIFDIAEDLYGCELAVALIAFLRPDERFPDRAALAAAIARDAEAARRVLAAEGNQGASARA